VLVLVSFLILALIVAIIWARRLRRDFDAATARHTREWAVQREAFSAAQRAERARVEAMLDAMIEGLVVIDAQRHMVAANRAAEEMFSFSRMMAGGMLLEAIRQHEVAAIAQRAMTEAAPVEQEIRIERPQPRILQVSAVALHAGSGDATGAVLVFHDVTRLRQLEGMRQDFVANVSHELRTPLSLIRSAAETLLDGGKSDAAVTSRFLEIIDRNAGRLTALIDDLLLLSRLDSGRLELECEPVELRAAVQESMDDAQMLAQARGAALTNDVAADLRALADVGRLREVLGNLIGNAIKYGREQGHVVISGRRAGGGMVEVSVRDDGPGIPPEATARVFERFYRVDKARSREQGGTGLGLAIVKNLIQAHGGDVRVDSQVGKGATFTFTLPVAE
jgi:two-component system, OmpR family, phosphate regulon sensor histidine kinase PhoR